MSALAIVLTTVSLLRGPPTPDNPPGFVAIAPLTAFEFLIALIAIFLERERHGLVRALLTTGACVLAVAGFVYVGRAPTGTLIFAYWMPAILALLSVTVIAKAKRAVRTS